MADVSPEKSSILSNKQRILMLLICPLIFIAVCSVAIVYTVHGLEGKDPEEAAVAVDPLVGTQLPPDAGTDIAAFCDSVMYRPVGREDERVVKNTYVTVHDIEYGASDSASEILDFISAGVAEHAQAMYEPQEIDYGFCAGEFPVMPNVSGECSDMKGEYSEEDRTYNFFFTFKPESFAAEFFNLEDSEVYTKCKKDCSDTVGITDDSFTLSSAAAEYVYDARREYVKSIKFIRDYKVVMNADFYGYGDMIGSGMLTFFVTVTSEYDITRAGIFIEDDEIRLTKNGFQTLDITANVSPDTAEEDVVTQFISSDESVVKVDDSGTVEAVGVSDTPVTVTVKLTYLGRVFEDSCTVWVTDSD